ncbi:MAG: hypothetical protein MJY50_05700 [Bacteroidales bacterium]|nr:hypothetical protein [Bacteroidales bacterium]
MKKLFIISLALLSIANASLQAQEYSDEYLDSVAVTFRKPAINDYMTIGVNYGVTFSQQIFNPRVGSQEWPMTWNNISVMFTRYCKLFGYMPYFGIEAGFEYAHQGFKFKQDSDKEHLVALPMGTVDNISYITEEIMDVYKIPVRSKFHVDISFFRIMADLGFYGGLRRNVRRQGIINDETLRYEFAPYENKFDYGMEGGAGFAFIFDPIEIHFNVLAGWSWNSLYQPDSSPSQYSQYYYRYANPLDIMVTAGIHFQLTKRKGKTTNDLKKEAYEAIYSNPDENTHSQNR